MKAALNWTAHMPFRRVGIYAPAATLPIHRQFLCSNSARIAGCGWNYSLVRLKRAFSILWCRGGWDRRIKRILKSVPQAIAALAYGTKTIPQVDKIVDRATLMCSGKETRFSARWILIWLRTKWSSRHCEQHGKSTFAAADMLAQIEHDEMARRFFWRHLKY